VNDDDDGWEGPNHWINYLRRAHEALDVLNKRVSEVGILTAKDREATDLVLASIITPIALLTGNNTRARVLLKRIGDALGAPRLPPN
jgi:hypothetical protein